MLICFITGYSKSRKNVIFNSLFLKIRNWKPVKHFICTCLKLKCFVLEKYAYWFLSHCFLSIAYIWRAKLCFAKRIDKMWMVNFINQLMLFMLQGESGYGHSWNQHWRSRRFRNRKFVGPAISSSSLWFAGSHSRLKVNVGCKRKGPV